MSVTFVSANLDLSHLPVLMLIGAALFGGAIGAKVFQRLKFPQVVGYIVIGLIIGQSGLKLIKAEDVRNFQQLNLFALGIIGFLVGGELVAETFRKYGRQFVGILIGEGVLAFGLVAAASGILVYFVSGNGIVSLACGLVLGAIASATDPASTIDVLWEYRGRGVLTTALIAVVALDDALAMTLYGLGTTVAELLLGGNASFLSAVETIGLELFGSVVLGLVVGLLLHLLLRRLSHPEKGLTIVLGAILLVVATSAAFEMDVILATMAMGVLLINIAPHRSKALFEVVRRFAAPIYVIFFVLVGARLGIGAMPTWLWGVVGVYVLFRTVGKMLGTYLGAKLTGAAPAVRKYGGLGLFAQGGVAVGLSIMASQKMGDLRIGEGMMLGDMIIFTVTGTTLAVQLLGPPMVKLAIKLAGEINMNVTREDLIEAQTVGEVMEEAPSTLREDQPLQEILHVVRETKADAYPVVDSDGALLGVITIAGLKASLGHPSLTNLLVAYDLMEPVRLSVLATTPLGEALEQMRTHDTDYLPVVEEDSSSEQRPRLAGLLERRSVEQTLSRELLRRQDVIADHEQTHLIRQAIQKKRKEVRLKSK